MGPRDLRALLEAVASGRRDVDEALEVLGRLPVEETSCARIDHHRLLRTGLPEAVYGAGKSVEQLVEIIAAMLERQAPLLATRVDADKARAVRARLGGLDYDPAARILYRPSVPGCVPPVRGTVVVAAAGTSDLPVAREAVLTLEIMGHPVEEILDVGVAGIHRLLAHEETLRRATAVIAVAGMEGALPGVVAGLTPAPVVAVPVSVGYGVSAGGYAALAAMLGSCAPGLAVVNIDNGFGAACMAAAINRARDADGDARPDARPGSPAKEGP